MSWLQKYKPEAESEPDDITKARFAAGNEIGDLAMGYFGDFVEVTVIKDDMPDLDKMIENTKNELEKTRLLSARLLSAWAGFTALLISCAARVTAGAFTRSKARHSSPIKRTRGSRMFICSTSRIRSMCSSAAG